MTVYLVGAGPGDPDLITVRGLRLLERADVVVYDRLTAAELLGRAPKGARRISVGKDPSGHSVPQGRINELLVELGRESTVVVRLKGGDPFVFARGSEEIDALVAADIDVEVVPGVTSALAVPAYAGIPVTRRFDATSVTIVTGHEAPGGPEGRASVDWEAVARVGGTIVILMGAARITEICERLIAGGADPETAAAAVRWGTTTRQTEIVTTLGELPTAGVAAPSVIVIGEVVEHRHDWLAAARPLRGRQVVVTRPEGQTGELAMALAQLGADVVVTPALRIVPPTRGLGALAEALTDLSVGDWLVVTSPNGARVVAELLAGGRLAQDVSVAAIGPSTAAELRGAGIGVDLCPPEAVAESLVEVFPRAPDGGATVVLARAEVARAVLPEGLAGLGWKVLDVAAYRSVPNEFDTATVECLRSADAVTVTSSSIARLVLDAAGVDLEGVVTIGPVTSATVREMGGTVAAEADPHTTDGLIAALIDRWTDGPASAGDDG